MALDFTSLTAQQIHDLLEEKKITKEQKQSFKKAAFVDKKEKVAVKIFANDGSPVMYQVKTADGSPKLDKNGNPVMRQKIEMVEKKDGKTKKVFSLLNAKWWVADNFQKELKNVPNRKENVEEEKAGDLFKDW